MFVSTWSSVMFVTLKKVTMVAVLAGAAMLATAGETRAQCCCRPGVSGQTTASLYLQQQMLRQQQYALQQQYLMQRLAAQQSTPTLSALQRHHAANLAIDEQQRRIRAQQQSSRLRSTPQSR